MHALKIDCLWGHSPRILLLALAALSPALAVAKDSESGADYYLRITKDLRTHTGVLPPAPQNVHPVDTVYNREAIVPPQCYTQTGSQYNPCYVCHQDAIPTRENAMNDGELQVAYSFSDLGMTNHWKNLYQDRTEQIERISDQTIQAYVNQENYSQLAGRLQEAGFKGWIPDLQSLENGAAAFDGNGFALDGSGWVAFNYKPFPSTFWPTNGSTDDVMIRLPKAYRSTKSGVYSENIYRANLAIVESRIKGLDSITCLPVDEVPLAIDLNQDGQLGMIQIITKLDAYVGAAEGYFIDTFLYPEGTEFLHTVRYLGIDESGNITIPKRMKEVRYMKKWRAYPKAVYARQYQLEAFEKEAGNLPGYINLGHYGLDNGNGWSIQGFIEGSDGRLRANTFEENLFCMGCHNSIGTTIDKTFSFARKVDGAKGWSYIDLRGMPDAPSIGEVDGEILTYLKRVGGGSEFRNNEEMRERWFNPDGSVNVEKVSSAKDVYTLITPTPERAQMLNKAYKLIVEEQDFILGRDATVSPPENVHEFINNEEAETLPEDKTYKYDIRLNWSNPDN